MADQPQYQHGGEDKPPGQTADVPPVNKAADQQANPYKSPPGAGGSQSEAVCDDKDAVQWGMFAHLSGLIAGSMLLMGFIGPLIIWLVKKDEHPFVDDQGKEALNFQINVLGIYLICFAVTVISCGFLGFIMALPWIWNLVFGIIATIQSSKGIAYRYPACIRLIS